jgi:hypothetical protein
LKATEPEVWSIIISMKLYSYIVIHDTGFSPNPFWGFCTLADCKPTIRRTANVDDWIVGLTPKSKGNKIVYAMEMSMNGEEIRISKSKVNDIIREEKNYQVVEVKQLSGHLYRPPEPSIAFAMDFTEKVIAGGERAYIFNILDKYNDEKIVLDSYKSQDADAVIYSHGIISLLISQILEVPGKMDLLNVILGL